MNRLATCSWRERAAAGVTGYNESRDQRVSIGNNVTCDTLVDVEGSRVELSSRVRDCS